MPKPTFFALPAAKRARVVKAAVREFGAHSYAEASLDRIADKAGVSKGSLYQYFADKRDLYRHLVTEHLPAQKRAAAASLARPSGDLFATLADSFHAGLALFRSDAPLAALAARAAQPAGAPEIEAIHAELADQAHAGLCALVRQAQADGVVDKAVAVDLAAEVVAALFGRGLWSTLARRAGQPADALLREPKLVSALDDGALDDVVHDAEGLLRRALSPRPAARAVPRAAATKSRVSKAKPASRPLRR